MRQTSALKACECLPGLASGCACLWPSLRPVKGPGRQGQNNQAGSKVALVDQARTTRQVQRSPATRLLLLTLACLMAYGLRQRVWHKGLGMKKKIENAVM